METIWYSTQDAADRLNYSVKTITRLCRSGELRHSRTGNRGDYRFRQEWLDEFMEIRSTGGSLCLKPQIKASPRFQNSSILDAAISRRMKSQSNQSALNR